MGHLALPVPSLLNRGLGTGWSTGQVSPSVVQDCLSRRHLGPMLTANSWVCSGPHDSELKRRALDSADGLSSWDSETPEKADS